MPRQRHRHRISFALDDFYMTLPKAEEKSLLEAVTHHKMRTANDRDRWPYRLLGTSSPKSKPLLFGQICRTPHRSTETADLEGGESDLRDGYGLDLHPAAGLLMPTVYPPTCPG
jgi:hypothetical protein